VQDEIHYRPLRRATRGPRGFYRQTNFAGGLEGGMTTGQPIVLRAAMKPIRRSINPSSRGCGQQRGEPGGGGAHGYHGGPAAAVVGEAVVGIRDRSRATARNSVATVSPKCGGITSASAQRAARSRNRSLSTRAAGQPLTLLSTQRLRAPMRLSTEAADRSGGAGGSASRRPLIAFAGPRSAMASG